MTSTSKQPSMRPFLVIWVGQAFSLIGSQIVQFAIVWWLTRTTGSATLLALATLAALLPQIVLGPFAGALVDRWSRRTTMIAADTAVAVATLVLAILFLTDHFSVWAVYALLMVRATGAAFHWPAMQSSTTLLVPPQHLARVAGMNQTLSGMANIVIPPLGALAVEALPMYTVLAIDVATAIPAITALLLIAIPQPPCATAAPTAGGKPSIWADMRAGLSFVAHWKGLLLFSIIGLVIGLLGRAAAALGPILVTQHFHGGALQLAWWQSAVGVGTVLGGLALVIWGGFKRRIVTSLLALTLDGLAILVIASSPPDALWLAVIGVFCAGLLETILFGINGAIGQTIIPPHMQGRVFSLLISASYLMAPLGLLIAGPFADAFGVQLWWALTGLVITVMGVVAFLTPSIVHIEEPAYQPAITGS